MPSRVRTAAWIFFRADSFSQAVDVVKHILLIPRDGFGWASAARLFPLRPALLALLALLPCVLEDLVIARNRAFPAVERTSFRYWGLMLVLLLAIAVFGVYGEGFDPRDFVYFNF